MLMTFLLTLQISILIINEWQIIHPVKVMIETLDYIPHHKYTYEQCTWPALVLSLPSGGTKHFLPAPPLPQSK